MQTYALEIIENLYMANCIKLVYDINDEEIETRKRYQNLAMTKCRLLNYITMIARESSCITAKQHTMIAGKSIEIQRMLYSWQQSNLKRIKQMNKG